MTNTEHYPGRSAAMRLVHIEVGCDRPLEGEVLRLVSHHRTGAPDGHRRGVAVIDYLDREWVNEDSRRLRRAMRRSRGRRFKSCRPDQHWAH
jgi:hypothetical protein